MVVASQHQERILLSPTPKNHAIDVEVQLISKTAERSVGTTRPHASSLPGVVSRLLERHNATRVTIVVAQSASASFPRSPLDRFQVDDPTKRAGASGLSVVVDLLRSDFDRHALESDFLSILSELFGHRLLLVSTPASFHTPRLHRYIRHHPVMPQQPQEEEEGLSGAPFTTVTGKNRTIYRLSMVCSDETDASSAMSAEGMQSWLTALQPRKQAKLARTESSGHLIKNGLWKFVNGERWSNFLISSQKPITGQKGSNVTKPTAGKSYPRSLWLDFKQSGDCYSNLQLEGHNQDCIYTMSQGMSYTRRIPKLANSAVVLTLKDILPSTNDDKFFHPSSLCERTELYFLSNTRTPDFQLQSWCDSCLSHDSSLDNDVLVNISHLPPKPFSMSEPLVTFQSDKTAPTKEIKEDFWTVNLNVARPTGLSYRGSLVTTVRNEHTQCDVDIVVYQDIPAIIRPLWASLTITTFAAAMTTAHSGTVGNVTHLKWTELDEHIAKVRNDGSVQLSFRHRVPSATGLSVIIDYDPSFLSINSIPGNANRGIDMPPLTARFIPTADCRIKWFHAPAVVELTTHTVLVLPVSTQWRFVVVLLYSLSPLPLVN